MKVKNRVKKSIKPVRPQADFGMTYGEYRKTPEYVAKMEQEYKEKIQPELERLADQVREVMTPALSGIADAVHSISWPMKLFDNWVAKEEIVIPATPSPEARMENMLRRFETKFDKDSGGAIMNTEVRNANCRFCSKLVMRLSNVMHFTDATLRCAGCDRLLKVPSDLTFTDIN